METKLCDVTEPFTRVTLFVPGTPNGLAGWSTALGGGRLRLQGGVLEGDPLADPVPVDWIENDGRFGEAFSFGTVSPEVLERLEGTPGALVLRWPVDLREGREQIVAVVQGLRAAGAIAVRLEESKVGWEVSRWLELFSSNDPGSWHRGAVMFLKGEEVIQSCGMHAFSLPDVRAEVDGDAEAMQILASSLNVYQLAEDPLLFSGHTFRPDDETPRRTIDRWPDIEYPPDHLCHNPYGVWRLGPPGGRSRGEADPQLVFVPALRVLLEALAAKQNQPLTKGEVEAARDQAACIAMAARDAQKLERSRGYTDVAPELVWEQWELLRRRA